MKHYVLGFAIDLDSQAVLLIKKNRPKWQEGLLNGIGGKIEALEIPHQAMVREFKEETGIETQARDWKHYATMKGPDWDCLCFKSFSVVIANAETKTDEVVEIVDIDILTEVNIVSNLIWLIHMAMDSNYASSDNSFFTETTYR